MHSEKYRSSSKKKRKEKRNRIQVNEKKNHLIPNRYLVVENGSNSKNKNAVLIFNKECPDP